jgi:hypothetical protein
MLLNDWYINNSDIHGDGIFSRREFQENEPICILFIKVHDSGIPAKDLVRTEFCKYVNHHNDPNSEIYQKKHYFILKAKKNIQPDDEITANYNEGLAKMISGGFPEELNGDKDSLHYIPHSSHQRDPYHNEDDERDIDPIF